MDELELKYERVQTGCCVVGGGPAGMVLGLLLARAGVDVTVLEKHGDFLRDFRGDTIHPSTTEVMYELGLLEEFLQRPHQELREIGAVIDGLEAPVADFTGLPTHAKFMGLMPQWEFLNFVSEQAKAYSNFHLYLSAEARELVFDHAAGGRVIGVRAKIPGGGLEVGADLVVGADGRHSLVREKAAFEVIDLGAPIDVLWMRVPRHPDDPNETLGRVHGGKILVTLNRGDYWQCAYVIGKGEFAALQQRGLPAFRADLEDTAPFFRGRTAELKDWNDIKLLSVALDRLRVWSRPGLLCIGDSAHAMSPVGGVGINLAIQDAVATANILSQALYDRRGIDEKLGEVQRRREFPVRVTQGIQKFAHKHLIGAALARKTAMTRLPLVLRLLKQYPALRRIPARAVGLGVRPEHVASAQRPPTGVFAGAAAPATTVANSSAEKLSKAGA
ncbi:MAG TPA: FAD-dependent oxidoreductase [Candidatus Acidoferrales bacterium]